jgi:hypothetical protein
MTEAEDDVGTWLTKAELAHVRGISIASATRLIRRQGWRRQPGNDGRVRVLVPEDWMHPRHDDPRDDDAADPMDQPASPEDQTAGPMDTGGAFTAFETALAAIEAVHARELTTLREQIAAAEQVRLGLRGMVEQFAGQLRDVSEAAKLERDRAAAELADLQRILDAARAEFQKAQEAAEAMGRAEAARKARGLVARLRAAWRGE